MHRTIRHTTLLTRATSPALPLMPDRAVESYRSLTANSTNNIKLTSPKMNIFQPTVRCNQAANSRWLFCRNITAGQILGLLATCKVLMIRYGPPLEKFRSWTTRPTYSSQFEKEPLFHQRLKAEV